MFSSLLLFPITEWTHCVGRCERLSKEKVLSCIPEAWYSSVWVTEQPGASLCLNFIPMWSPSHTPAHSTVLSSFLCSPVTCFGNRALGKNKSIFLDLKYTEYLVCAYGGQVFTWSIKVYFGWRNSLSLIACLLHTVLKGCRLILKMTRRGR